MIHIVQEIRTIKKKICVCVCVRERERERETEKENVRQSRLNFFEVLAFEQLPDIYTVIT